MAFYEKCATIKKKQKRALWQDVQNLKREQVQGKNKKIQGNYSGMGTQALSSLTTEKRNLQYKDP